MKLYFIIYMLIANLLFATEFDFADPEQVLKAKIFQVQRWGEEAEPVSIVKIYGLNDTIHPFNYLRGTSQNFSTNNKITVDSEGKLKLGDEFINNFEGGKLKDHQLIFVMDNDGKMWGVKEPLTGLRDGISHSSLVGEQWPVAAGTLMAENGELRVVMNDSGHFQPKAKTLDYVKAELNVRGANLSNTEFLPSNDYPYANPKRFKFVSNKAYRQFYFQRTDTCH